MVQPGKLRPGGLRKAASYINGAEFGFETGDTSRWDTVNDLSAVTSRVYSGSYAGRCSQSNSTIDAEVVISSTNIKFDKWTVYWQETSSQSGAGFRAYDSNNALVTGGYTDNPQWEIETASRIRQVYSGDGYDRWTRFTFIFDWDNGTFDIDFEDLQSGTNITKSDFLLKSSLGISYIQLAGYKGGTWQASTGSQMWYDNIILD